MMRMLGLPLLLVFFSPLPVFFSPLPVSAATWYVDASVASSGDGTTWATAFRTIQEGTNAASHGDTVLVAQGTYVENIEFNGKNITLTSTDPLNPAVVANTIIDGSQSGPVVTFSGTEDETCVLSGFTVRNGSASSGSGIRGSSGHVLSRATIRHNFIVNNRSSGGGAGLYACGGAIEDNVISGNSTALYGETRGGGLWACHGTIQRNVISGNSSDFGGGLGYCYNAIIRNNIIVNNTATLGGALYECGGLIENNTIVGNSAREAGGIGYCFECIEHYDAVVKNCIVWGNVAKLDYQVSEGTDITFSCIQEWMGGGEGNISLTPHFVDAENDEYHLQSWSPCIDAGDPASLFANEPDPNGGRVNMGAYGNTPEAASQSEDSDSDGLPDDWETYWFSNLHHGEDDDPDQDLIPNFREYRFAWDPTAAAGTTAWNLTTGARYEAIQSALWESTDGDEILVFPGVYKENIRFLGRNVVLRSTVPTEADVVASTVIDGMGKGPVVAFVGTESEMCVLSGFTITNGEGGIWGGYVSTWGWDPPRYTHATIQNNMIACNLGSGVAYSNGAIRSNLITHNSASCGGGLSNCGGTIENNIISKNRADNYGGGLHYCSGRIRSNTIVGNRADKGGGIHGSAGLVRNCILWGNAGSQVSGTPTYCCIEGWTEGGEGNIAEEPRFVNASSGNLRLMPDSPCVDAGFNDPELPETDIAGMHRIMFGGKSLTVDMGAYEFYINRLDPVPATDEAVFTWSSLWPKSYAIYYSDDLVTWHVAAGALPSAGTETTSWTDDGSLTGLPPMVAPKRFYRLFENP